MMTYERFTDRARKVMQYANQESHRLKHEYIGTEHILLGLLRERNGVAAQVLKSQGVSLDTICGEIEKVVQPGPPGEMVVLGRLPLTPRAKEVLGYAIEEAQNLHHRYVGTEHILLGLLRAEESLAGVVLKNLDLQLDKVRGEVLGILKPDTPGHEVGLTPKERECLEHIRNAWNSFVAISGTLPSDSVAFADAIHRAASLVAIQVARRVNPDAWQVRQLFTLEGVVLPVEKEQHDDGDR